VKIKEKKKGKLAAIVQSMSLSRGSLMSMSKAVLHWAFVQRIEIATR
jgi:hypothetical protein